MRVVALISGGKDSCFNMMNCVAEGHEIVALANLKPKDKDELDSYMYQTVGHHAIDLYAEAMGLPLFRRTIEGGSIEQGTEYNQRSEDEVEDLYQLLNDIKKEISYEAVSVGAILSDYQRVRVEHVCVRLGLIPLAYLWRRDQKELLAEMINCGVDAILIKVAALGLTPEKHLGKTLSQIQPHMLEMEKKYGLNPCGEGGEYETLTLDCPLFNKKMVIDEKVTVLHSEDAFAPVAYLNLNKIHLQDKGMDPALSQAQKVKNLPLTKSCDTVNETLSYLISDDNLDENLIEVLSEDETCDKCVMNRSQGPEWYIRSCRNRTWFTLSGVVAWSDEGSDIEECTKHVMDKLTECLQSNGLSTRDLVAVHLYVHNMANFARINAVYKTYFRNNPPVRICVETNLPESALWLLDCTAHSSKTLEVNESPDEEELQSNYNSEKVNRHTMHVQGLSHWAPANIGPYSQCVQIGEAIYVAGQIALVPSTLQLVQGGIHHQACLSIRHVDRVLKAISNRSGLNCVCLIVCYIVNRAFINIPRTRWMQYTKIIEGEQENNGDIGSERELLIQTVVVPNLPRGALIEWEVYATKQMSSCVTEKICQLQDNSGELKSKCICQHVKCEDSRQEMYSFVCVIEALSGEYLCDNIDRVHAVMEITLKTILMTLQKYNKSLDSVLDELLVFRFFYCCKIFATADIFKMYSDVFKEVFGSERTPIPPAFVPVLAMENEQILSVCH